MKTNTEVCLQEALATLAKNLMIDAYGMQQPSKELIREFINGVEGLRSEKGARITCNPKY